MATVPTRRTTARPPQLVALHEACERNDASAAHAALSECLLTQSDPLDLGTFHRVLALAVSQPMLVAYVRSAMAAQGVLPNEQTITLSVRSLVLANEPQAALEHLCEAQAALPCLKARTFAPLLKALCSSSSRDRKSIRQLEQLMASSMSVQLSEEQLVDLTAVSASCPPTSCGCNDFPSVDVRLQALQQAVPWVAHASVSRLQAVLHDEACGRTAHITRVSDTAVCGSCGSTLSAFPLSVHECDSLRRAIERAAAMVGAESDLRRFGQWLTASGEAAGGAQIQFVIDGANVAYHGQNVDGGRFSFDQLESARALLREQCGGREPWIVLPQRCECAATLCTSVRRRPRTHRPCAMRCRPRTLLP